MTTSETNKKILGKCFFTHQKNALEMTLALITGFGRCFSLESVESMFVFLYYTILLNSTVSVSCFEKKAQATKYKLTEVSVVGNCRQLSALMQHYAIVKSDAKK